MTVAFGGKHFPLQQGLTSSLSLLERKIDAFFFYEWENLIEPPQKKKKNYNKQPKLANTRTQYKQAATHYRQH